MDSEIRPPRPAQGVDRLLPWLPRRGLRQALAGRERLDQGRSGLLLQPGEHQPDRDHDRRDNRKRQALPPERCQQKGSRQDPPGQRRAKGRNDQPHEKADQEIQQQADHGLAPRIDPRLARLLPPARVRLALAVRPDRLLPVEMPAFPAPPQHRRSRRPSTATIAPSSRVRAEGCQGLRCGFARASVWHRSDTRSTGLQQRIGTEFCTDCVDILVEKLATGLWKVAAKHGGLRLRGDRYRSMSFRRQTVEKAAPTAAFGPSQVRRPGSTLAWLAKDR